MGACFSAIAAAAISDIDRPTAKVVVDFGSLVEYSVPVPVSQVLGLHRVSCFLCNSDSLRYGGNIEALGPDEFIRLGDLYFMLALDKLDSALSGPDMAALAVKASSALGDLSKSRRSSRRESIRVMPIDVDIDGGDEYIRFNERSVVGTLRVSSWRVRNKERIADREWPKSKKMNRRMLNAIEEVVEEADE